jgi:hypothetical protein
MGRPENSSGRPGLAAWGGRRIARVAQDPSSLLCYIKEEQKIVFLCSVSDPGVRLSLSGNCPTYYTSCWMIVETSLFFTKNLIIIIVSSVTIYRKAYAGM